MMGNKDYLSGVCLDTHKKKKSENDYLIMPENFNKNLEQKRGP